MKGVLYNNSVISYQQLYVVLFRNIVYKFYTWKMQDNFILLVNNSISLADNLFDGFYGNVLIFSF